jgi:hypothetical protein
MSDDEPNLGDLVGCGWNSNKSGVKIHRAPRACTLPNLYGQRWDCLTIHEAKKFRSRYVELMGASEEEVGLRNGTSYKRLKAAIESVSSAICRPQVVTSRQNQTDQGEAHV